MDSQSVLVLAIIVVSLVLFASERISSDVIALGIVIVLIVTGVLTTNEAFAGFGSDAVMMILGLLILTASLTRTGVVELAGRLIFRFTGEQSGRILIIIMVSAGVLGAFISNAATTAFFLPIVIGLAKRAKVSPSKYLMPLAFASILSSSVTLISTSTNIVVSGMISQYGMRPLGMYELAPVGIPVFIVGLIYMYFVGIRLIPDRAPVEEERNLAQRLYLTEIIVQENSTFVGKTLTETRLGQELNIQVLRIVRDKRRYIVPTADTLLEAGDVLLVECERSAILMVKDLPGIDIRAEVKFADIENEADNVAVVEVILLSGSPFIGRTLRGLHARDRFRLQVLAVNRYGEPIRQKLSFIRMKAGDVLLIQGDRANLLALEDQGVFRVLDAAVQDERPDMRRAPRALVIFGIVLVISAFEVVPLPVAALTGAVLAFVTRCITPEEAYRLVEWKVIILVGSMLALGKAMEVTGTAEYLAQHLIALVGTTSPLVILMAFFVLTVALTPLSHSAAAIVVLPIAIRTAQQLGLDPRAFVIAIAVAATNGYLTPLDQVSVMVYGPGHYRFTDFVKVGALLTVVIFALVVILVPLFWPLV